MNDRAHQRRELIEFALTWPDELVTTADAARLDEPARALLTKAAEAGGLSARGWTRTLRLARTIADLEGSDAVRRVHVAEALIYRRVAAVGAFAATA